MFANNPDFGIMEQAYMKLKTQSKAHGTPTLAMMQGLISFSQIPTYSLRLNPGNERLQRQIGRRKKKNCRWRWLFPSGKNPARPLSLKRNQALLSPNRPARPRQRHRKRYRRVLPQLPSPGSELCSTSSLPNRVNYNSGKGTLLRCLSPCTRTGGRAP